MTEKSLLVTLLSTITLCGKFRLDAGDLSTTNVFELLLVASKRVKNT